MIVIAMADPSVDRETTIYTAKLAEQTERFDGMAIEMSKVAKMEGELTLDERNLVSVAYKNAIGIRRASWKFLSKKLADEGLKTTNGNRIFEYRKQVEKEITDICRDIIVNIDDHLILKCRDAAVGAYYFKIKGDYIRYLAEIRTGVERNVTCDESIKAYETATSIARDKLPPAHPIRLNVALNFAVFYHKLFSCHGRAIEMAKEAVDEAIPWLGSLNDKEAYKNSTLLIQILRNNMVVWAHLLPPAA